MVGLLLTETIEIVEKKIVSRFIEAKQPAVYVSEMNTVYILKVGF
jgi:hypothetical protein